MGMCWWFYAYILLPEWFYMYIPAYVLSQAWLNKTAEPLHKSGKAPLLDPSHRSHNALVKYPTMHYYVIEICTHVHISVVIWCTEGYGTGTLWDLCNRSVKFAGLNFKLSQYALFNMALQTAILIITPWFNYHPMVRPFWKKLIISKTEYSIQGRLIY